MTQALLLLSVVTTCLGCAGTAAYQRAKLAQPKMQLDPDPDATLLQGTGDVTLQYGMVDGNCMMDSLNDDVKVGNLKLSEGMPMGMAPPRGNGVSGVLASLGLVPAIGIVAAARRRRRS